MNKPIKNAETESHAKAIAKAISDENTQEYMVAKEKAKMDQMARRELLAFRDRVHFLIEEREQ